VHKTWIFWVQHLFVYLSDLGLHCAQGLRLRTTSIIPLSVLQTAKGLYGTSLTKIDSWDKKNLDLAEGEHKKRHDEA
jgi:hypothetical protein